MALRTYILPFAQKGSSLTAINNWVAPGSSTTHALYVNNNGEYYIQHVDNIIENVLTTNSESLRYLGKTGESINLLNFETAEIKVELESQLNNFYEIKYILVRNETSNPAAGEPDFLERFEPVSVEGASQNVYKFVIGKVLRINSVGSGFILGLQYRQNVLDGTVQEESVHNPLDIELVRFVLSGKSLTNSVFDISVSGSVDLREYRKRVYIRDGSEIGYLAFDTITEKYNYTDATPAVHTVYTLSIVDSVLYNVVISGNDASNNTLVKEVKIASGKLVLDVNTTAGTSAITFCEVHLKQESLARVPDANVLLTITKS